MDSHHLLYGARTGNCLRAAVALEEAGLPFAVERLALRKGEHKGAAFLAINPLGLVPALAITTADGRRTVLTESNAIMFYAAETTDGSHLLGGDLQSRAIVLERFFYFLTEVVSPSISGFKMKGIGLVDGMRFFDERLVSNLSFTEGFLREQEYMAGDAFSLADILAYTMVYAHKDKLEWTSLANLEAWFNRVAARPGVQRGMSRFG